MTIESSENTNFKLFKSLLSAKGIKKNNLCIVSGRKIVPEFINCPSVYAVVASEKSLSDLKMSSNDLKTIIFKDSLFAELDSNGTHFPLLIYKTPIIQDYNFEADPEGLEVVTGLGDPSNQGALIRSCEAFNVKKIILLKNSCHPFLPRTIKASSGSSLRAPLSYGPFIHELPANSFYSLDKKGIKLKDFTWPKNIRLLMGEEGPGLPRAITPIETLAIPMKNSVESLNATIASSISLYSYYQTYN